MELGAAGLQEQPFRSHGIPLTFFTHAAQEQAFRFLNDTYANRHGLGLFQGPPLSGKSTIIRQYVAMMPDDSAVAVVDGTGLDTTALISSILHEFGYDLQSDSVNELINMLKVFLLQQTASDHAPLLIIENTHALHPDALRVLCDLATLKVKQQSALRLLLASDRSIISIVNAPAMDCVLRRLTGDFHLQPLSEQESTDYLYAKLRVGGCLEPKNVIPPVICAELYAASGGWPGVLDQLAMQALEKAPFCPLDERHIEHPEIPRATASAVFGVASAEFVEASAPPEGRLPKLVLTLDGETLQELTVERPRVLIGRSEHNDIYIDSKYISRHHAMLICNGQGIVLMDLNSTNGTYVNSRRISNQVLLHSDVISVGNHRIKFVDEAATGRDELDDGGGFADTIVMKNLDDMRRLLAKENTHAIPVLPEKTAEK